MTILRHPNCQIPRCAICMADHEALREELENRTGNERVDHLGRYHLWLSRHGIPAETEWGWASPETFDETNVSAYVKEQTKWKNLAASMLLN